MRTERPPAGQLLQDGRAGGTIMAGGLCAEGAGLIPVGFLGKPTKGSRYTAGVAEYHVGDRHFVRVKVCRNIRY